MVTGYIHITSRFRTLGLLRSGSLLCHFCLYFSAAMVALNSVFGFWSPKYSRFHMEDIAVSALRVETMKPETHQGHPLLLCSIFVLISLLFEAFEV